MDTPQEIEVWYVLPALRREIAIALKKQGLKQKFNFNDFRLFYVHDDCTVEELTDQGYSHLEICCLNHFLGLSTNSFALNNKCFGCTQDYDLTHYPCNYDCENFKPIRFFRI